MATKAKKKEPAAPKKSTAVAVRAQISLPANIDEIDKQEMAEYQKRLLAPTGNRIAVTQAKKFRLPSGEEADEIEAVIVDFAAGNFYYPEAFDRDNIVPPKCFAIGLDPTKLVPSDKSKEKQHEDCAGCWANQFKSHENGKAKACQNTRQLALLPPDADVESPLNVLKVSSTGSRIFDDFVAKTSKAMNKPMRAVIVRFTFSPEYDYPSMRFEVVGPCPKDLYALAFSRKDEAKAMLLAEPDYTEPEEKAAPAKGKGPQKPKAPAGKRR